MRLGFWLLCGGELRRSANRGKNRGRGGSSMSACVECLALVGRLSLVFCPLRGTPLRRTPDSIGEGHVRERGNDTIACRPARDMIALVLRELGGYTRPRTDPDPSLPPFWKARRLVVAT